MDLKVYIYKTGIRIYNSRDPKIIEEILIIFNEFKNIFKNKGFINIF